MKRNEDKDLQIILDGWERDKLFESIDMEAPFAHMMIGDEELSSAMARVMEDMKRYAQKDRLGLLHREKVPENMQKSSLDDLTKTKSAFAVIKALIVSK